MRRLREKGIKLKPGKCDLFKQEVRYLGHKVSGDGYCMDDADKAAVLAFKSKCPTNVGELRQILGFIGYYHSVYSILRYVKNRCLPKRVPFPG